MWHIVCSSTTVVRCTLDSRPPARLQNAALTTKRTDSAVSATDSRTERGKAFREVSAANAAKLMVQIINWFLIGFCQY